MYMLLFSGVLQSRKRQSEASDLQPSKEGQK